MEFIAKRYHTSSLFTLHFSLKNKTPPGKPKGVEFTRYHLDSQHSIPDRCEPVRTLVWQSPGADALPQKRCDGRARRCLPIDTPAPRPCSAFLSVPLSSTRGSLDGHPSLLFSSSHFFDYTRLLYPQFPLFVNQFFACSKGTVCVIAGLLLCKFCWCDRMKLATNMHRTKGPL